VCAAQVYRTSRRRHSRLRRRRRRRLRPRWLLYMYNVIAEGAATTAAEIHAGPHTGYIRICISITI